MPYRLSLPCLPTNLAKDGKVHLCDVHLGIDAAIIADAFIRYANYDIYIEANGAEILVTGKDLMSNYAVGRITQIERLLHNLTGD